MARALLKCVPDDDPNAEGVWLNRRVPAWALAPRLDPMHPSVQRDRRLALAVACGGGRFDLLTRYAPPGHHVVAYRQTRSRRPNRGVRSPTGRWDGPRSHGGRLQDFQAQGSRLKPRQGDWVDVDLSQLELRLLGSMLAAGEPGLLPVWAST